MKLFRLILILQIVGIPFLGAELRFPAIIGDQMILQRDQPNRIWGWDDPGTVVTVSIAGGTQTVTASASGDWEVMIDPLPATGEPLIMKIEGTNSEEIKDILAGEVWLCSGQSNMSWTIKNSFDGDLAVAEAGNPHIRLITVPRVGTQELQDDFSGAWAAASGETVSEFSAVALYFGQMVQRVLDVPVGLIHCSWGGSSAEAWVRRDLLEDDPRFASELNHWRKLEAEYDFEAEQESYRERLRLWEENSAAARESGAEVPARPRPPFNALASQIRPGNLYAGMLYPIIGYGIRGTIWYQGESNVARADNYRDLFTLLIEHWREEWGQGPFSFYWVQLANYLARNPAPGESAWAELREAQTETLETVVNGGQAVIIDLGEGQDIHPRNKRDVGYRLARLALAKDYGIEIAHRSPEVKSARRRGDRVILKFEHVGAGLRTFDVGEVIGFSVAGSDGVFSWATGKVISPDTVEIWSEAVPDPAKVRYAWADNPACNLYSAEGLPVTPFRRESLSPEL